MIIIGGPLWLSVHGHAAGKGTPLRRGGKDIIVPCASMCRPNCWRNGECGRARALAGWRSSSHQVAATWRGNVDDGIFAALA